MIESQTVFIDLFSTLKRFPDLPLDFVEKVLKKRDDLEKTDFKEAIENIKSKLKEIKPDETQATLFSRTNRSFSFLNKDD